MSIIDVSFPTIGTGAIPRQHGLALYGALCRALPSLHGAEWLGVHPLSGKVGADADMLMPTANAALRLRIPVERLTALLPLMGVTLSVAGHPLQLGAPTVFPLAPSSSLDARIVVLKLTDAPKSQSSSEDREVLDNAALAARYQTELSRQAQRLGISSEPVLCGREELRVHGKRIVGFSVRFGSLSADESLALQRHGLGGKRRMGCGIFRPTRGA